MEYRRIQLTYGGYRSGRVIFITLLNGQQVVKFNLLDRVGNVLYTVEYTINEAETRENKLTYGTITDEQIEDIQTILTRNEPSYDWNDDELEDTLKYFGYQLMQLEVLAKYLLDQDRVLVDYTIYANQAEDHEGNEIEERSDCVLYETGTKTRDQIENALVQKLLKHKSWDRIKMTIIEKGQFESYLLEFEERRE